MAYAVSDGIYAAAARLPELEGPNSTLRAALKLISLVHDLDHFCCFACFFIDRRSKQGGWQETRDLFNPAIAQRKKKDLKGEHPHKKRMVYEFCMMEGFSCRFTPMSLWIGYCIGCTFGFLQRCFFFFSYLLGPVAVRLCCSLSCFFFFFGSCYYPLEYLFFYAVGSLLLLFLLLLFFIRYSPQLSFCQKNQGTRLIGRAWVLFYLSWERGGAFGETHTKFMFFFFSFWVAEQQIQKTGN